MAAEPPESSRLSRSGEWYRRSYPLSGLSDAQVSCLDVLAAADPLYNWSRTGERRRDGGFRPCGDGVEVRMRFGSFSTYDDSRLTRLVVAAHRHAVRLAIRCDHGLLIVQLNQRSHEAKEWYSHHPSLADLAATCTSPAEPGDEA